MSNYVIKRSPQSDSPPSKKNGYLQDSDESFQYSPQTIKENSKQESKMQYFGSLHKQESHQYRALIYKNLSLQKKQVGTNLCQIFTPLISLVFVFLIKKLAQSQFGFEFQLDIPFLFNIPSLYQTIPNLVNLTCLEWYLVDFDKNITQQDKEFVGFSSNNINNYTDAGEGYGIFKNTVGTYDCMKDSQQESTYNIKGYDKRTMPYFQLANQSINQYLYEALHHIDSVPYQRGQDMIDLHVVPDGAVHFYSSNLKNMSYKVLINDVRLPEYHRNNGITKISYKTDPSQEFSRVQIRVAEGQLSLVDLIHRAFLHEINDKIWLVSGVSYMPAAGEDQDMISKMISITASTLLPIALSLLYPIFMYLIVLEKEEKLLEMMKMNGLSMVDYWFVNILFQLALTLVTYSTFYVFGYYVLELTLFTKTSFWIIFSSLLGWGFAQVGMAIFFQVFLNKARSASIIGYLLSIMTSLIAIAFNLGVYPDPFQLPYFFRIYPPFAFSRIIYLFSIACTTANCYSNFSQISEELSDCIILLYYSSLTFLILGIYLNEVIPQDYGTPRHPLFFLQILKKYCLIMFDFCKNKLFSSKNQSLLSSSTSKNVELQQYSIIKKLEQNTLNASQIDYQKNEINLQHQNQPPQHFNPHSFSIDIYDNQQEDQEDEDCQNEREFVDSINDCYSSYPLICKDLVQVYKAKGGRPSHKAVKNFSLCIRNGEIFGLLGPNGAGKTSLINMITGVYPPSEGNAWIAGHNILTEMNQVHLNMGVCPQFDLLWPDLTVEEHLYFYARLKGVHKKNEKACVEKALNEVYLQKFSHFLSKELSGGMKRRLSVAISLVGDPKIVFLDEPSTGLDPDNRRQLWEILSECRGKRAIVLTTHQMEEADVLCTRIGIITNGVLRCIGPQQRLKSLYGKGYHIYINCYKERQIAFENSSEAQTNQNQNTLSQQEQIAISKTEFYVQQTINYIVSILPQAKLVSNFNGIIIFQVPNENLKISQIFQDLEKKKVDLKISDWGISQSSLEDVFIEIVDSSSSGDQNEKNNEK